MDAPTARAATDLIQIDDDFDGANVALLDLRLGGETPEAHFTASPKGGPEAMWFHFRVVPRTPLSPGVRLVLHFVENLLGGQAGTPFHPVIRTRARDWQRVARVETTTLGDGRSLLAWTVPGDEGAVDVALCYPYGPAELDALLADTAGTLRRDPIGVTQLGRPIPRLSNTFGDPSGTRPGIYCLARQHAAETPGSWVLDGFLRRIAEAGDAAPLVWATPFANLDGVHAGEFGKDGFPWDFNRAWGSKLFPADLRPERGTHPMRHEVRCLQNDLLRWRDRCRPLMVLDFHAPTLHEQGIYCYLRSLDEAGQPDERHKPWVDAFREALDPHTRAERFARSGRYPSRWNTARVGDFVTEAMKVPQVTIESTYACNGELIFTRDTYRDVGRSLAEAALTLAR